MNSYSRRFIAVKTKVIYVCQKCGAQYPKWSGYCTDCGNWNSLIEEVLSRSNNKFSGYAGDSDAGVVLLSAVKSDSKVRLSTTIEELDRVLGGGLVIGSTILVGGDPGIGKSTLLLQALCRLSKDHKALYLTGEESLQQVAIRARRLELLEEQLLLMAETQVEKIIAVIEREKPEIVAIDSIQTIYTDTIPSAPGGAGQIRESTAQLARFAKQTNTALFIVGHVTKEGTIAGPKVLEHMVDCVLYFEGDRDSKFRIVRATKNRFGTINELGIFAMTDRGLKEVSNPSAIFLANQDGNIAGSSITVTWEGSRPLLIEVQALVDKSYLIAPRRVAVGLEQNRLSILLAVLHKHGSITTHGQDIFVNIVGGVRIGETAVDLSLLAAVVSSIRNRPLERNLVIFGEVGLAGEIRPVHNGQERLKAAIKHGFKKAIIPKANLPKVSLDNLEIVAVESLREAIEAIK